MGQGVLAAAAASVVAAMIGGCVNIPEPAPFDPREITKGDRVTSTAQESPPLYRLPTTRQDLPPTTEPTTRNYTVEQPQIVRMSIREIMHRAAANSNDVRVAGYDPAVAETKVTENEAHYDPVAFMNARMDRQADRTPGTVIPNPANPTATITIDTESNNIYTTELGVKQYLQSGGQIQLSYQAQESSYFPVRYTRNDYWDSELKLQLTQPLLREFGYEINWARITVARNDQRVSILDYRKALEDNTDELEKDYWQLYEAQRDVEISEGVLNQARDLARLLWDQFWGGGRATSTEASQAQAEVERRKGDLELARQRVGEISDDIKRRMGDPDFRVAGPTLILPADVPVDMPIHVELKDQIETAMANRLELGQQQLRENSAEVARQVARNGLFPKLDFVGSLSLQGLSKNLDDAISDQFGHGHMIFSLGLQMEIPLGNREASSIMRRADLQRMQAIAAYQRLVWEINQDVATAWREINTTYNALNFAITSRMYRESVLTNLNALQESGQQEITPQFVQLKLGAQNDLADAQRAEIQQLTAYNIAISHLEKAKGTILRYNNIMMEEDQLPWNVPAKR